MFYQDPGNDAKSEAVGVGGSLRYYEERGPAVGERFGET
jgi:hypothetical protein